MPDAVAREDLENLFTTDVPPVVNHQEGDLAPRAFDEVFEEVPADAPPTTDEVLPLTDNELDDAFEATAQVAPQEVGGDIANAETPDLEAGLEETTPEIAESVITESIERVINDAMTTAEKIQEIAKLMPTELMNAILEKKIVPYERGYYSFPAFKTSTGLFILKFQEISRMSDHLILDEEWVGTFMRYLYSKVKDRDYFEELSLKLYAHSTKEMLRDSYNDSDFAKDENPFIIKKNIDIGSISFYEMYFMPIDGLKNFLTRDIFSLVMEFSKRNMNTEADISYVTKILPEVKFLSEVIENPECLAGIPAQVSRSLTVRKIISDATGSSFYSITGPKSHIARVSSLFKNIMTDESYSYQGSYAAIAETFLSNEWWHPNMNGIKIPNPEKIFIPDLCTNLDESFIKSARNEINRIRLELIPEGSVLALPSPFVFKESSKNESDMTYLTDFMTPNSLVPNTNPNALGGLNHEIDEDIGPISKVVSCGILTKDRLNSPRDILNLPSIPDNATIILKDLELK